MIDSWGSLPSGRYHGNKIHYGHFEQCLELKIDRFEPQFCLLPINRHNESSNLRAKVGVCVPSSCSNTTLQAVARHILSSSEYDSLEEDVRCIDNQYRQWGALEYIATAVVLFFVGLVLFSTGYEAFCHYSGRKLRVECTAFSLVRNLPSLMSTQSNQDIFECLNAIRVVTIVWIIINHLFFYLADFMQTMHNAHEYTEWRWSFWYIFIKQSQLGADTFLIISGLCLAHNFFKARSKG